MGLVFVIRKESRVGVARRRHRLLYKSSRIQKWQMFSESDRRGLQQFEIKSTTNIVNFKDVKKKIVKKWQHIQSTYEIRY